MPPLSVTINQSPRQKPFQRIIHLLAMGAVLLCTLPLTYKIGLSIALTMHYLAHLKTGQHTLSVLVYQQEQGWQIIHNGRKQPVRLLPTSIITPHVVILYLEFLEKGTTLFALAQKLGITKPILITVDSLSPEDYRQLVMTLKITWRDAIRTS